MQSPVVSEQMPAKSPSVSQGAVPAIRVLVLLLRYQGQAVLQWLMLQAAF